MCPLFYSLLALLSVPLIPVSVCAQGAANSYSDSAAGFRLQLEDLITTDKAGDEVSFREKLHGFAIPEVNDWIAARFSPQDASTLEREYPSSLLRFQANLTEIIEKAAHTPGYEVSVWASEPSTPPNAILSQNGLPLPVQSIAVECFRYGSPSEEGKAPKTLVNSFVYVAGKFRYVGGIFPFWWADLHRGAIGKPQLTKRVAPEYPKNARKKRVEGIVRIFAIIGKDGAPRDLAVVRGDPLLADSALEAVRQWRYQPGSLSGVPIEIETTVDVVFQLKR